MSTYKQRQVKLFISSTFKGLYDERDVLAKHVFPEIHRRCQQRKVDFVEIDLRWGIPKEQVKSGTAVPVCLARIDEGRPYFLGLLGERYGSAMKSEQIPVACDQYPWVEEYKDKSITELEILHALFPVGQRASEKERQTTVKQALFYFRDPNYAQTQSKSDDYLEVPSKGEIKEFGEEEANRRAALRHQKQANLKQRIRAQGCQITKYQKPDDLKTVVLEQLWTLIDKAFPEGSQPTEQQRENLEHDAFALSRQLVYIHRQDDFDRLTAHALDNSTQPLVILGESGIGKSALLANWGRDYQEKHSDDLVFWHFCGSSPASTDPIAMLRRLMLTLQQYFHTDEDIPTTAETVIEQLPLWLAKVQQRRMIVIFDGLNQLEINQNIARWLPTFIPANIRLFLSTLSIQGVEGETFTIAPLSESEQGELIKRYLARFGRQLDDKYIEQLVAASQTDNPLYLQVILEELRLFGNFSKLGERLAYYLEAKTIPDLYQKVLARLEEDYQLPEYPHIVSQALCLLWATRRGLSESELLTLLSTLSQRGAGGDLPQAVWSPLYLALSSAIVNRAGLLNFFHDYLRQAVEQSYLTGADQKKVVHRQLADFFEQLPLNTRKADELPYQLEQAGEKTRLQDCISEIRMFLQLMRDDKEYELLGYWVRLGNLETMAEVYWDKINSLALKFLFYRLGRVFHIIKPNSNMDLFPKFSVRVLNFLRIARISDKEIEPVYRVQALIQKWMRPKHVNTATSLANLAMLLQDKGDYDAAEPLFRRALAIEEQVLGTQHHNTATSMANLATLLHNKGNYDEAETLYRRALGIHEQVLGTQHPDTATSLNNLAMLLRDKRDYDGAEPLCRRTLAITEQVLGAQHPNTVTSLNNLALLLQAKEDYDGAEPLFRRALAIREQMLGVQHPLTTIALNNLASLLEDKGNYDEAEPLYERALVIKEQVLSAQHPSIAISLDNLAFLLKKKGDYDRAESLYRRALIIFEKALGANPLNTVISLNGLASLLKKKGDYDEAESLYRRALAIREQVLGAQHPDTADSLHELAHLLQNKKDYDGAEPLYRTSLEIAEKKLGTEHLKTAGYYYCFANFFMAKGDYDEAEPLYRRALAIAEKVLGHEHPNTTIFRNNLAELLNLKTNSDNPISPQSSNVTQQQNEKVSRNADCPCGSGKRYKACCGKIS
jgi:nephrocystin-3